MPKIGQSLFTCLVYAIDLGSQLTVKSRSLLIMVVRANLSPSEVASILSNLKFVLMTAHKARKPNQLCFSFEGFTLIFFGFIFLHGHLAI
jgi:hypothetical protein